MARASSTGALREYRRKRDFRKTPEPAGERAGAPAGDSFVIHKHDASRLHYDLRLEMDGTLKSWAVPKGPSLDPGEKRLAVHVEDHPLDYAGFEGTIPEGEYGGGTVMIWDRGRWIPQGDPRAMYRKGHLRFNLEGEKLRGGFSLVRMKGEAGQDGRNWLLIKHKDPDTHAARADVLERAGSVATGRSMEQIASAAGSVWHSGRPAPARGRGRRAGSRGAAVAPARIPAARRAASLPASPRFELATLVRDAPEGDAWLHEIKFDGYRAFCRIERGKATFITRGGHDWTASFPTLAEAAVRLPARAALLDGEVVKMDAAGASDFQALQNSIKSGGGEGIAYMVFDLLHLDGYDLTASPLESRKEALRGLCDAGAIRYSGHIVGQGPEASRQACRMALEGIVSKRRQSVYRPGRSRDWLKIKCLRRQELVIGGLTRPEGSRSGFGSLLVGYHDDRGRLRYAGKVGTGFTEASLLELAGRLESRITADNPFDPPPPSSIARRARWTRPDQVAEVEFTEWTRDGRLRHPVFRGLREDKAAHRITRERTADPARTAKDAGAAPSRVAGVRITNPDRVLYAGQGITKRALALYYEEAAPRMLPYVAGRPLMLVRCPQGSAKECFYQKHAGQSLPDGVHRVPIRERGSKASHSMMVDSVQGLVGLAQMGVLEIHLWGARAENVERPDILVLDLDPDPDLPWDEVARAAFEARRRLTGLGMRSFVKTTGGKGLHLVTPLVPGATWEQLKSFAHDVARGMVNDAPQQFTSVMTKARRKGKIYVDYLRNGRGATFIAPYSTRRSEGAPVSAPLTWSELTPEVRSDAFTIETMSRRLRTLRRDPWSGFEAARRPLTAAMRRQAGE
ncbi:MAG: DNA ligase D [Candidatus Polarisedimenticolia bacterium]